MKLCVFNVAVTSFSPTRLAGEDDIREILGVDEIPAAMHPLLRQKVLPADIVRPFEKTRKKVRDYLVKHATRDDLLGWVTSPDRADAIRARLQELQAAYLEEKQDLLARYDGVAREHLETIRRECEGYPGCERFIEVLRSAQPTREHLQLQIGFRFIRPKMVELHPEEVEPVRQGLFAGVVNDIAARAKAAHRMKGLGAQRRVADELVQKLRGLSYFDARYGTLAEQIGDAVRDVPRGVREGEYTPAQGFLLTGVFSVLADPDTVTARVEGGEGLFPSIAEPYQGDEATGHGNAAEAEPDLAPPTPQERTEPAQAGLFNW